MPGFDEPPARFDWARSRRTFGTMVLVFATMERTEARVKPAAALLKRNSGSDTNSRAAP